MKNFCITWLVLFLWSSTTLFAQVVNTATIDTTDVARKGKLTVGGYIDTYFGYDHNQPKNNNHPYGVSSFRHNEFNINLAFVDVKYTSSRLRARFVPGFGTYMNANYANEPVTLRNIVEANIGVRLFKDRQIWLDAGVFGSPYTNESYLSKDHLMYSRSLSAEFSPYYLTGIKLSTVLSSKINAYVYVLNGWQNIQETNNGKAIGTQVEYRPSNKVLLNWNTYIGDESTDSLRTNRMRYFTDFYMIYNPDGRLSLTTSAYIGWQERQITQQQRHDIWWQANIIGRYRFTPTLSLSGRLEYFHDQYSVQILPITNNHQNGFRGGSAALCLNVQIIDNVLFRLEHRSFMTHEDMFLRGNGTSSNTCQWSVGSIVAWF